MTQKNQGSIKGNSSYTNDIAALAYEFESFIFELMRTNSNFRNVQTDVKVGKSNRYRADIIADVLEDGKWETALFEIRFTRSLTTDRIEKLILMFSELRNNSIHKKAVLIFPGILNDSAADRLNKEHIDTWDINRLSTMFSNEIKLIEHPVFNLSFFEKDMKMSVTKEDTLIDRLRKCEPGIASWRDYQKLVGEILEHLFCPPLNTSISELADAAGVNRRDFIFPNYSESGFWSFVRDRYDADYIVVDAKNYKKSITKKEVLQIANYLKKHGTGLFGIIVTRCAIGQSASFTLREVWMTEKKLITVVKDNDLVQMLSDKKQKSNPETYLRQLIEDFRLSL